MVNLGRVLEEKSQYANALIQLRKGLAIREKVLEEGHPDTVSALAWIGVRQAGDVSDRFDWLMDVMDWLLDLIRLVVRCSEKGHPDTVKG